MRRSRAAVYRHINRKKIIIAICVVVIFLIALNVVKEKFNQKKIDHQIANLEKEIYDIERSNLEIGKYIDNWERGGGAEKEARLKLGLKKPGESVIIINRSSTSTASNTISENAEIVGNIIREKPPQNDSNPAQWWRFFFH